jgi:hypothetical protein
LEEKAFESQKEQQYKFHFVPTCVLENQFATSALPPPAFHWTSNRPS